MSVHHQYSTIYSHTRTFQVSSTAIHFVISGLEYNKPVRYAILMGEPSTNYAPSNLAPVSILAKHHSLVGRFIVDPSSLSFAAPSADSPTAARGDSTLVYRPFPLTTAVREKRSQRNFGRPNSGLVSRSRMVSTGDDNGEGETSTSTSSPSTSISPSPQHSPITVDKVLVEMWNFLEGT